MVRSKAAPWRFTLPKDLQERALRKLPTHGKLGPRVSPLETFKQKPHGKRKVEGPALDYTEGGKDLLPKDPSSLLIPPSPIRTPVGASIHAKSPPVPSPDDPTTWYGRPELLVKLLQGKLDRTAAYEVLNQYMLSARESRRRVLAMLAKQKAKTKEKLQQ
jgi:hypothetical protein